MSTRQCIGAALLSLPVLAHFAWGVLMFGWGFPLLFYGLLVCLVVGAILVAS